MTMIGEGPLSPLTGIPGWLHDEKEEYNLVALGETLPSNGIGVCIGVQWGRDVAALAYGTRRIRRQNVQLYAIQSFTPEMLSGIRHNMEQSGYDDMVAVIDDDPFLVARRWKRPIDLLYIRYTSNQQELCNLIQAWLAFLNNERIVAFMDYWKGVHSHPDHLAVKQAVDSWHKRSQWRQMLGNGSLVWYVAPKASEEAKVPKPAFPDVQPITMDDSLDDVVTPEQMTVKELIKIGERAGMKMGRYKRKDTIIKALRDEGIIE